MKKSSPTPRRWHASELEEELGDAIQKRDPDEPE
jgi:hypothetical protein